MSKLSELKLVSSISDVAKILGFKQAKSLAYVLYKMPDAEKYTKFQVPKRSSGSREICAPQKSLKRAQAALGALLLDCQEEILEMQGRGDTGENPDRISHGFKRRRSIVTNAVEHRNRRFVFNVDIENFFGSINFGRVRGFLIKDKNFLLSPDAATLLAQVACFENSLPQGSPCSPVLSNLIAHVLDIHLVRLAAKEGVTYSRYADDLTFSTNQRTFPKSIAVRDGVEHQWVPGKELRRLVERSGFALNVTKTRMQYCDSRQVVTGLTVNRTVAATQEYRHKVRAMIHRLITTGTFDLVKNSKDAEGKITKINVAGKAGQLRGMVDFIASVANRGKIPGHKVQLSSPEVLYRSFLMYTEFYAAEKPLLLCEGQTDNVYLAHAARALHALHPLLASKAPDGKISLAFKRHRYPYKSKGRTTARLLGLHGGTPQIAKFIAAYRDVYRQFGSTGGKQPVIVVIDNDGGSKAIFSALKEIVKKAPTRSEDFIHVFGNLYVVATPLTPAGADTRMEDFFDVGTTSTRIGGKPFNPENDHDSATHYGKSVFAHKVVKANADKINFVGFSPLLKRIELALAYHQALIASP